MRWYLVIYRNICYGSIYVLKLSRPQNSIKSSRTHRRVKVWNFSKHSGTDSVLTFRDWLCPHLQGADCVPIFRAAPWRKGQSQSLRSWKNFTLWRGCLSERILLNYGSMFVKYKIKIWRTYVNLLSLRFTGNKYWSLTHDICHSHILNNHIFALSKTMIVKTANRRNFKITSHIFNIKNSAFK
jgi:hypothetical protein